MSDELELKKEIELEIRVLRAKANLIKVRCDGKKTTLCNAPEIVHDMLMTAMKWERVLLPKINNTRAKLPHIEGLDEAVKMATPEEYDTNGASGIVGALFCESRLDAMIILDAAKEHAAMMEDE